MDIIVKAKDFSLTPSLHTFVEEKIGKVTHFWEEIIRADVEMGMQKTKSVGNMFFVNVRLEVPGPDIKAEAESPDIHSAIDEVVVKLERQIRKVKGKYLDRRQSR